MFDSLGVMRAPVLWLLGSASFRLYQCGPAGLLFGLGT